MALARELVGKVYALFQRGKNFSVDYGLKDQIRRASESAMSNIAEDFERFSDKEFIQFLVIAKGSVGAVRSQLYVATDLGYIRQQDSLDTKEQCELVSRHISKVIKHLKSSSR